MQRQSRRRGSLRFEDYVRTSAEVPLARTGLTAASLEGGSVRDVAGQDQELTGTVKGLDRLAGLQSGWNPYEVWLTRVKGSSTVMQGRERESSRPKPLDERARPPLCALRERYEILRTVVEFRDRLSRFAKKRPRAMDAS